MAAADLLVCCRCGCGASRVYRAPAGVRCVERDPRMWETHNGPARQVCGSCVSKALDGALSAMRAYAATVETCPECRGEGASVSERWCLSCDQKARACCCESPDWGWDDSCETCNGAGVVPLRKGSPSAVAEARA